MTGSTRIKIVLNGDDVLIEAPYDPEFNAELKKIKPHRWDHQRRVWVIPRYFEFQARKLAHQFFPPEDEKELNAWKEEAADQIRGLVLFYLPAGIGVMSQVIEELNGSTTVSLRRDDARDKLEEVNFTVEDEWRLRESANDNEAEYLAEKLFERDPCWLDFNSKPKPKHSLPPP